MRPSRSASGTSSTTSSCSCSTAGRARCFDWDILFLLPLPWWGPVLAPVCIAVLLVVGGTLVTRDAGSGSVVPIARGWWRLSWAGIALALYVFMADALRGLRDGLDVTTILPQTFNWPVFWLAVVLMAAPILATVLQARSSRAPQGLAVPR